MVPWCNDDPSVLQQLKLWGAVESNSPLVGTRTIRVTITPRSLDRWTDEGKRQLELGVRDFIDRDAGAADHQPDSADGGDNSSVGDTGTEADGEATDAHDEGAQDGVPATAEETSGAASAVKSASPPAALPSAGGSRGARRPDLADRSGRQ